MQDFPYQYTDSLIKEQIFVVNIYTYIHVKFLKLLFQKTIKTCNLEVKEGQAVYTIFKFNLFIYNRSVLKHRMFYVITVPNVPEYCVPQ